MNKTHIVLILYIYLLYVIISLPCSLVKVDGMERSLNKHNARHSRTKPSQNLSYVL